MKPSQWGQIRPSFLTTRTSAPRAAQLAPECTDWSRHDAIVKWVKPRASMKDDSGHEAIS